MRGDYAYRFFHGSIGWHAQSRADMAKGVTDHEPQFQLVEVHIHLNAPLNLFSFRVR